MPTGAAWPGPVSGGEGPRGARPEGVGGQRGFGAAATGRLRSSRCRLASGVAGASVSVHCGLSRELGGWESAPRADPAVTGTTVPLRQAELLGLTAEEVYLVHDDLDKPLGKLALKLGGSAR